MLCLGLHLFLVASRSAVVKNSFVLFPSTSVSVSHQIKAVINKMGPLVPFRPIPTFSLIYTAVATHACLLVSARFSLYSHVSGYHCGSLSILPAFQPAWIENFFHLLLFSVLLLSLAASLELQVNDAWQTHGRWAIISEVAQVNGSDGWWREEGMEGVTEDNKSHVSTPKAFPYIVTKLEVVCVKHKSWHFLCQ